MLKKDTVIRVYGEGASRYDDLMAQGWRARMDHQRLIDALDPGPRDSFLEIGVGTGLNIPYYPPQSKFTGIDITKEMLEEARKKISHDTHSLLLMDGADLQFEDAVFDGILITLVISACPDPVTLLKEAFRVTKNGGRLSVLEVSVSPLKEIAQIQEILSVDTTTSGFPPPTGDSPGGGIVFDPTRDIFSLIKNTGWTVTGKEFFETDNPISCHVYISAQKNVKEEL